MKNFVTTQDEKTAQKLRKLGFSEVFSAQPNVFVFMNQKSTALFEQVDKNKIVYTDMLCL